MTNFTAFADWAISNAEFDADWYRTTFPDVTMLRMDPEEHFRLYGALMGRAPNAALAAAPAQMTELVGQARARRSDVDDAAEKAAALKLPAPRKGGELLAAHEIALTGNHARAIHYAKQHLPPEFAHTLHVLEANRAVAEADEARWLRHLNAYLGGFGVAPLRLTDDPLPLLDRFTTDCTPQSVDGPLVSVIMPAWNAETTIRAAARSILNQTWRNLELLIVDDASDDGTWRIMQELAANDTRVRIRRNKVNVGPYVSKNIVLTEAKGEWITGHDADDWAHPERLERHYRESQRYDAPASVADMIRIKPTGKATKFSRVGSFTVDGITRRASISCLFSIDLLKNDLGYWDSVRFAADSEMITRTQLVLGDRFQQLYFPCMICLDEDISLTNDPKHGIMANSGKLSNSRAEYKASWTEWLEENRNVNTYLPLIQEQRRYTAPNEMTVCKDNIQINLNQRMVDVSPSPPGSRGAKSQTKGSVGFRPSKIYLPDRLDIDLLSNFLFKHVPHLTNEVSGSPFGTRGREWAWRWGYWGRALSYLYLATNSDQYLRLLDKMHDKFILYRDDSIGLIDEVRGKTMKTWGTIISGKHDRGYRACEVESTGLMILPWVSLLHHDTRMTIPKKIRDKWVKTITEAIDAHISELTHHSPSGGGYFMSPWFDHKVEPINHANIFGAACALSYGVSGNNSHRLAANEIYRFFTYNWRHEEDNRISWAYNPTETSRTHGPRRSRYGDKNHKTLIGPELFYKAAVSIELPVAMYMAKILPNGVGELKKISRSIRESIFLPNYEINYYISRNKRHYSHDLELGSMPIIRAHYMCGFELLGCVDGEMSVSLEDIVQNRKDLFPRGWFSGPAGVMAYALKALQHPLL